MQSFAILGSHPKLSLAEIQAVTGALPSRHAAGVAIFDDLRIELGTLNNRLGGVQKLGVVIGSVTKWEHQEMAEFLANDLAAEAPEGKVHFGVSVYSMGDEHRTNEIRKIAGAMGLQMKSKLKDLGRSARYVISREPTLSSVVVTSNHLLNKGAEYIILVTAEDIIIGKTSAVQDVDSWSNRDFGRPRRNAKQGMLSPKLARMMLNLSGVDVAGKTVLDPFCGSGTVLMEAAELHAGHLYGGDIAKPAIYDTETNLKWLQTQGTTVPASTLAAVSAATYSEQIPEGVIDLLITETYLGRPRKGKESHQEIMETMTYLETLYRESFSSLKKTLKPGATVVLAAPVHEIGDESIEFDAVPILEELGYTFAPTPFEPVIYRHKGQLVGRRLLRFHV